MPRNNVRFGCSLVLLVVAVLGFIVEYFGKPGPPGDDEGSGPLFAIGILGLIAFIFIFGLWAIIQTISARLHRDPRGFPVEPPQPPEDA
jgi:hypothetical protein